jgi:excisionase family DNA binding protein
MTKRTFEANTNEPVLLTDDQTAHLLGVGRTTVWKLLRENQLETVRIGRCRRIVRASALAYVDRLRGAA